MYMSMVDSHVVKQQKSIETNINFWTFYEMGLKFYRTKQTNN
jgi:hypothetical protein